MAVQDWKLNSRFFKIRHLELCGFLTGALLVASGAAFAQRDHHAFTLGPACQAAAKPQDFAGEVIVDRLLIGDISPHGYSYQSRHCKLEIAVFWADSLASSDFWEHISRMFYRPLRLSTEIGPRLIEATITGRIVRHQFSEGEKPVWTLEVERISNLKIAPEGYCAVNPQDWFDLQKTECSQAEVTTKMGS